MKKKLFFFFFSVTSSVMSLNAQSIDNKAVDEKGKTPLIKVKINVKNLPSRTFYVIV